jgi:hypothetical protein
MHYHDFGWLDCLWADAWKVQRLGAIIFVGHSLTQLQCPLRAISGHWPLRIIPMRIATITAPIRFANVRN